MKKILVSFITILLAFHFVPTNTFAEVKDQDLTVYLTELSTERGFTITKDDYVKYLEEYSLVLLSDFENIQELEEYMGAVIKSDNSNLESIYEDFELDEQQLIDLLATNGEAIENYIYVDDLYFAIFDFEPQDELPNPEEIVEDMDGVMKEIDLTDEEIENLMNHFLSIESKLNSPEVGERLMSIAERMMGIDPENPTEEQIKEVGNAFEELLSIFKLKASFYIVEGNIKTQVSASELMQMEVLTGDYLLIQLFDLNGNLLADVKFTSDDIKEIPTKVEEVADTVKEEVKAPTSPKANESNKAPKTVKGGKLPITDSNNLEGAVAGAALIGLGLFLYRRVRIS
jgi:processed acidic surface protein